jgi:hypothetical protein
MLLIYDLKYVSVWCMLVEIEGKMLRVYAVFLHYNQLYNNGYAFAIKEYEA